ncbi:phosphoglucosamine mutase, partial [Ornithobacterium rhinotracheale]
VTFASAYGPWLNKKKGNATTTVVLGRDTRLSGEMVNKLVTASLQGVEIDVIDCGLSTTPTIEIMVPEPKADGGIILTA